MSAIIKLTIFFITSPFFKDEKDLLCVTHKFYILCSVMMSGVRE